MVFTVPKGWGELTQRQLRMAIRTMCAFSGVDPSYVKVQMLAYLCGFSIDSVTDRGFLCQEKKTGKTFILDPGLLPSMAGKIEWLMNPEEATVRLERWGEHEAVDFQLQELPFGEYLMLENYFQAALKEPCEEHLRSMARILYRVPEDETPEDDMEVLQGCLLWMTAVKALLARNFSHYFKPATAQSTSPQSIQESTLAQIRLLTKGDVTKNEVVLTKIDTWTALAELDAQAREADEINRKYGK